MNRLEHFSDGPVRAGMARGGTLLGRQAAAEGADEGQAFQSLLRDLAQQATVQDRREPAAAGDGPAAPPDEDGEDDAPPVRENRPTVEAAADVLADVARLIFAGSTADREQSDSDQAPTNAREAEGAGPRSEVAAEPARLPKTRVLTRETHFEPVRGQPAASPSVTATDPVDDAGVTSHDEPEATGARLAAGRAPSALDAGFAPAEARLPTSGAHRGNAPGLASVATGGSHVSDASPSAAVAAVRPIGTAAETAIHPDVEPHLAAERSEPARGRGTTPPPPSRDAVPTEVRSDTAHERHSPRPEPDRNAVDERWNSADAQTSNLGDRAEGRSASRDRSGAAAPTATRAGPAAPPTAALSAAPLPMSTLQRLAGAIAVEAGALAASPSPVVQPLGASQPATGGPVKVLVLRLQPEKLGTVTVRLRLVGNALELQLRAASADTADLLERDRGALEKALKASGYDADLSTIQAAPRDAARPPADPTGSQASPGRQDAPVGGGFRQGDGEQTPGRGGDGDDRPRRPAASIHTREVNDAARGQGDRPGGLYL
jgi:hypothetical protein